MVVAIGVILVFQTSLGGAYYLFTAYLQNVLGYNALQAGLAFVPLTLVSMAASLKLTGVLLGRWGVRGTLFAGMLVNGVGMVLLAVGMATGASFWTVLAGLLVWGVGGGLTFPAMFVAAASGVAPRRARRRLRAGDHFATGRRRHRSRRARRQRGPRSPPRRDTGTGRGGGRASPAASQDATPTRENTIPVLEKEIQQ